ncbi:MAG: hypothetical protein OEU86_05375, partial [Gammaproteobacteria bacterium]|nr:hypothetical protein [Gammaproteobacteria bacterium]
MHTDIATIGHTTGWRYSEDEDFRCSCGEKIGDCDLFTEIETQFNLNNLEYSPRNFGTAFRAVHNSRINQLM